MDELFIPTQKQIEDALQTIYVDGRMSLKAVHSTVKFFIEHRRMEDGSDITWKTLIDSYKAHIDVWNYKHKKAEDDGYLKAIYREERKNLNQFINGELYNRQWIVVKGNQDRDNYLFPNLPLNETTRQRKIFEEKTNQKKSS